MSYQPSAPPSDAPPTSCPICLETWNSSDRLPKFLICHHSICVTCAGDLQRTAKKKKKRPDPSLESSPSGAQHISASQESLGSLGTAVDEKTEETPSWVRCPMCRTRTFIEDPQMLQTNFYLRGLPLNSPVPRLVLWCETCAQVAAPECSEHIILPVGEKMQTLQDELIRRTDTLQGHVNESITAHESHMEVYRWLCGMLRHSHSKVLAALTHAAQYHRALHHHTDALQSLVNRSKNLHSSEEPEEDIKNMSSLLRELDSQQSAIIDEVDLPILNDTFQILRTHQGPKGYGKALVVLDADKSVTLSIFGENERQQASDSEDDIDEHDDGIDGPASTIRRVMSLQMSRRERDREYPSIVSLQKKALLKEALSVSDPPPKDVATQSPAEDTHEEQTSECSKELDSESEEADPTAPSFDAGRGDSDIEEVTKETEEPIVASEAPILRTAPVIPEVLKQSREGTYGRQTVNISHRPYRHHMCDEKPIIEPVTLLNNEETQGEQERSFSVENVSLCKEKVTKVAPQPVPSIPQRNAEEEIAIEEPVALRSRERRRKKGSRKPRHVAARKTDNGERQRKQRGRKQTRQRRKAPDKRASNSMCRVS